MISYALDSCIHCGKCKKVCPFLAHYDMDLSEFAARPELKGECYLCDNCKRTCPKNISGRSIAMEHRKNKPLPSLKVRLQKNPYLLRNVQKKNTKSLLYLGCNYPGQFPETCKKLIGICKEDGIDFSVDCCKKPVAQTGYELSNDSIFDHVKDRGIERLICCCPNCYNMMKGRSDIQVISVFEYLHERGLLNELPQENIPLYIPCGDREHLEFFKYIEPHLKSYHKEYNKIHCCGLGGGGKHTSEVAEEVEKKFKALHETYGEIWTYCASCSIAFQRYNMDHIVNILSAFLGVNEAPSTEYMKNVLAFRKLPHDI